MDLLERRGHQLLRGVDPGDRGADRAQQRRGRGNSGGGEIRRLRLQIGAGTERANHIGVDGAGAMAFTRIPSAAMERVNDSRAALPAAYIDAEFAQPGRRLLARVRLTAGHHESGARAGESLGDGEPDTPGAAGDDRGAPAQVEQLPKRVAVHWINLSIGGPGPVRRP